jgi:cell division septation protein DedD
MLPGRLVPAAVGRTAVAVGGIADSGMVLRLTRGRLWIGALATLLVGIVALNVGALQLSATSSKAARQTDELKRQNSALRAELAGAVSSERMQDTASKLGLIVPEPGSIRYVSPSPGDAAVAAKRLREGAFEGAAPAATVPVAPTEPVVVDPAAVDPAAVDPAATEPAAAEPAVAEETIAEPPATPAVDETATPSGETAPDGGVISP